MVPANDAAPTSLRDTDALGNAEDVDRRASLNVIVAEDDAAARRALGIAVRSLGHECREARDGLEAWEMYQREHADVIISDWQMPRMDGLELCRRTRASCEGRTYTYFMLVTGCDDKDHLIHGTETADNYYTKPTDLDELGARLVSASRVLRVCRDLAEKNAMLSRDSQASFQLARVDALTQVGNRLSMDEDLKALWSRATRYGHGYSIAICDIDWFKTYNDRLGHIAGDDALRRVAVAIREELRGGDCVYRYGGEEFLIVLPEQSLADATRAINRVRAAVERLRIPNPYGERDVLTLSAGVAELDAVEDRTLEDWLRRVDAALYRAKSSGRNRVEPGHLSALE